MSNSETLLKAILSMTARQALPVNVVSEIVLKGGGGTKQLHAFNMCDGNMSQGEVAKAAKIDSGNFSKTVNRWIDSGILFRLGEGRESRLLHVYPLPTNVGKKARTPK